MFPRFHNEQKIDEKEGIQRCSMRLRSPERTALNLFESATRIRRHSQLNKKSSPKPPTNYFILNFRKVNVLEVRERVEKRIFLFLQT